MRYETEVVYLASTSSFAALLSTNCFGRTGFEKETEYAQCRVYLDTGDFALARGGLTLAARSLRGSYVLKRGFCCSVETKALTRQEIFGQYNAAGVAELASELGDKVPLRDIAPQYVVDQRRVHREYAADANLWHCSFDTVTFTRISDNAFCVFRCIEIEVTGSSESGANQFSDECGILNYLDSYGPDLRRIDSKQSYGLSMLPARS
ncbi:hypothetical protein ACIBG0_22770 [Nocardia sp. NPDC050630]|uniref:hypothetical protein n=1 Tax=Nocardia sp. NPDC050630 TaxID=3364321 RepID=UPI0037B00368